MPNIFTVLLQEGPLCMGACTCVNSTDTIGGRCSFEGKTESQDLGVDAYGIFSHDPRLILGPKRARKRFFYWKA